MVPDATDSRIVETFDAGFVSSGGRPMRRRRMRITMLDTGDPGRVSGRQSAFWTMLLLR